MAGIRDKVARWTREGLPFELIEQRISGFRRRRRTSRPLGLGMDPPRWQRSTSRGPRRVLAD